MLRKCSIHATSTGASSATPALAILPLFKPNAQKVLFTCHRHSYGLRRNDNGHHYNFTWPDRSFQVQHNTKDFGH